MAGGNAASSADSLGSCLWGWLLVTALHSLQCMHALHVPWKGWLKEVRE